MVKPEVTEAVDWGVKHLLAITTPDAVDAHVRADNVLKHVLRELGAEAVVAEYYRVMDRSGLFEHGERG